MTDIKDLQNSIFKHSKASIQPLQLIKLRINAELKSLMEPHRRKILEADIRRCDAIIEQILCLEIMQEYGLPQISMFK